MQSSQVRSLADATIGHAEPNFEGQVMSYTWETAVAYRLCGVHVVAQPMSSLGEHVSQLPPLEVLSRDVRSLHSTVVHREQTNVASCQG